MKSLLMVKLHIVVWLADGINAQTIYYHHHYFTIFCYSLSLLHMCIHITYYTYSYRTIIIKQNVHFRRLNVSIKNLWPKQNEQHMYSHVLSYKYIMCIDIPYTPYRIKCYIYHHCKYYYYMYMRCRKATKMCAKIRHFFSVHFCPNKVRVLLNKRQCAFVWCCILKWHFFQHVASIVCESC